LGDKLNIVQGDRDVKRSTGIFTLIVPIFYGVRHMVYHHAWLQSFGPSVVTASFSGILGFAMAGLIVVMMQLFPAKSELD
jgi:hypothetical protein